MVGSLADYFRLSAAGPREIIEECGRAAWRAPSSTTTSLAPLPEAGRLKRGRAFTDLVPCLSPGHCDQAERSPHAALAPGQAAGYRAGACPARRLRACLRPPRPPGRPWSPSECSSLRRRLFAGGNPPEPRRWWPRPPYRPVHITLRSMESGLPERGLRKRCDCLDSAVAFDVRSP